MKRAAAVPLLCAAGGARAQGGHPDGSIRALRTSSMNSGPMVQPACRVTENFGQVTTHQDAFGRVIRG